MLLPAHAVQPRVALATFSRWENEVELEEGPDTTSRHPGVTRAAQLFHGAVSRGCEGSAVGRRGISFVSAAACKPGDFRRAWDEPGGSRCFEVCAMAVLLWGSQGRQDGVRPTSLPRKGNPELLAE